MMTLKLSDPWRLTNGQIRDKFYPVFRALHGSHLTLSNIKGFRESQKNTAATARGQGKVLFPEPRNEEFTEVFVLRVPNLKSKFVEKKFNPDFSDDMSVPELV